MNALMSPSGPRQATLRLEPRTTTSAGEVEVACRLQVAGGEEQRLWFRFPHTQPAPTERADPFVVAVLLYVMRRADHLQVHGAVSAGLLANLADFQHAHAAFHPEARVVTISADEIAPTDAPPRAAGLTAFSGGVDGAFSIFRHTSISGLQPKRPVHTALLMHGFDVPLDQPEMFARVAARCREFAKDAGVTLHTGATNLRVLRIPWETVFGTAVAAALTFFQHEYAFGLIPSAYSFGNTHLDHGSNPLMDPLLSSSAFAIVHDGAGQGRIDKLRHLAGWPAALHNLRVCWQGGRDDNCCRCEKCVRTMLMWRLCGVERSDAFPRDLSAPDIERLSIPGQSGINELSYLLGEAKRHHVQGPWVKALARTIARNRRYLVLQSLARRAGDALPKKLRASGASAAHRLFRRAGIPPATTAGDPSISRQARP